MVMTKMKDKKQKKILIALYQVVLSDTKMYGKASIQFDLRKHNKEGEKKQSKSSKFRLKF